MREFTLPIGHGVRAIPEPSMETVKEDWTKVRSKGRAARRRPKHRQNIEVTRTPEEEAVIDLRDGVAHVHPTKVGKLRERVEEIATFEREIAMSILPDARVMEFERYAMSHIGIWGWDCKDAAWNRQAFSRFPDLFGGDRAQLAIYEQARHKGPVVRWRAPSRITSLEDMMTSPTASFAVITFCVEDFYFENRVKSVLRFADEGSEKAFRAELMEARRREAEEDRRYGISVIDLKPERLMTRDEGDRRFWR